MGYYYHSGVGFKGFQEDLNNAQGGFAKAPGQVVYSWAENEKARKNRNFRKKASYMAMTTALVVIVLGLYTVASDFSFMSELGKYSQANLAAALVSFIVLVSLAFSTLSDYLKLGASESSSFVDIDRGASRVRSLELELNELKARLEMLQAKAPAGAVPEEGEPVREKPDHSPIESYIAILIKSLETHIETSDQKASKLLDTGTMYLRRGIYFYIASIFLWQVVAHVWGVDRQLIFGVVSCSLTFLVVEFLAAWFLKQYRSFIDSSVQLMRVKSVFDRYLLSYFAIREFADQADGSLRESRAQLLEVLSEEIKWPEALGSKAADVNHMVQMFDSLTSMLEKAKGVAGKKDGSAS